MDEATKAKAEAKYLTYYQLHGRPDIPGQSTAPFN